VPFGTNSVWFTASVNFGTNQSATAGTVTVPGHEPVALKTTTGGLGLTVETNTFANLSAAYPAGTYTFTISNQTTQVTLPSGNVPPNVPTLSDYATDQTINAGSDFTLSWEPFAGGSSQDYISVTIHDSSNAAVLRSEDYGCPGALDGTDTSFLIPADTLVSNATYSAEILFEKVLTLDTNSIHGDALIAGLAAVTTATIATGASVAPPTFALTNFAWLPGGGLRFDFPTTPGTSYTIQFNQNLGNATGWSSLLTTDAATTSVAFTNSPPAGTPAGFYRAYAN
jgi:hypothetical protein